MFAVLTLLLVGCGGGGDEGGSAQGDEDVELSVWVAREQYLPTKAWHASFSKLYPNIKVKFELQPDDALFNQLQRMAQAQQKLPDLVQLDSYFAAPMFELGLAKDMTDVVDRWKKDDPELYGKQLPAMFVKDGDKVIGLGTTGSFDVLYYRADWLEDAGVEMPLTSWDAVLDAARAVKKKHPDLFPWSMIATRGEGVNYLYTQMKASGVPFEGATPQLDTEAGRYVIDFYQTLVREKLASTESLAWGENEARGAWIGGRAAMMLDGIRSSNDIGDAIQKGQKITFPRGWRMAVPPVSRTGADTGGVHVTATRTFHITASAEHPYETSLVLRHMLKTPQALEAAKTGAMYLQKEVLAAPEFRKTYPYVEEPQIKAFAEGGVFPASADFFAIVEVLERMVQDILKNPDEPTGNLAKKWQVELDAAGKK